MRSFLKVVYMVVLIFSTWRISERIYIRINGVETNLIVTRFSKENGGKYPTYSILMSDREGTQFTDYAIFGFLTKLQVNEIAKAHCFESKCKISHISYLFYDLCIWSVFFLLSDFSFLKPNSHTSHGMPQFVWFSMINRIFNLLLFLSVVCFFILTFVTFYLIPWN